VTPALIALAATAGVLAGIVLARMVGFIGGARALQALQDDRLGEVDRMKHDFLSSVSHELRTPITLISGYLDLVLADEQSSLEPEQRDFLEVAARNGERLQQLVHDLLFVAQLDAGRMNLTLARTNLGPVVQQSIESTRPAAEAKGVSLAADLDPVDDTLADRTRIGQVADNLLMNALKFTPAGGRIRVGLRRTPEGCVVLEVADSGVGMSDEEQRHVFERFYRAAGAERNATPGTGLGLSIVEAIAEAHGGSAGVTSALGEGTVVRVELPALSAAVRESRPRVAA
jgi:signal transduction histidine kinase